MDYNVIVPLFLLSVVALIYFIKKFFNEDARAQRALNKYLKSPLSSFEVGRLYERYIGYTYEEQGYDVIYNGAINGFEDLGRDLIVRKGNEIKIIQAKCWSKSRCIREKHIFQLFGTATHFRFTLRRPDISTVKAVFYTTAQYSKTAREVADVLGIDLKVEELKKFYPMVKCSQSDNGDKLYYIPVDSEYDRIKVRVHQDEYFVKSVKEAVNKGFRRAA